MPTRSAPPTHYVTTDPAGPTSTSGPTTSTSTSTEIGVTIPTTTPPPGGPGGGLPNTGAAVGRILLGGLALLAAGAGLVLAARRRTES